MTIPRRTYAFLVIGAALWCGAIIAAPLLAGTSPGLSSNIYRFFHPVCHQIDARSFHVGGAPLAVCIRCSSIYLAFLVSLVLSPAFRPVSSAAIPSRLWLLAAVLPMVVDVALDFTAIHPSNAVTRVVTGCLFGLFLARVILPVAVTGAIELFSAPRILPQKGSIDA